MKIMVHIQTGGVQRVTTLDYALSQQWNVEFVGMSGLPITSINALYNTTIIENGIQTAYERFSLLAKLYKYLPTMTFFYPKSILEDLDVEIA